jgi:putative ABC transport system substrate-binding protein
MHELVPTATVVGLLVNPTNPRVAEATIKNLQAAAHNIGLEMHVLHASAEADFDKVFATFVQLRVGLLVIGADPLFSSRQEKLAALTIRHAMPAIYEFRQFAAAGGLLSYGSSFTAGFREAAVYIGRIFKGEKPSDLPVQQTTKVELILNLKTAKALGLTVPLPLIGRADEVIE